MISTLIKLHNEYVMEQLSKPIGTITWFKCEDQQPPPIESDKFGYSESVIATDKKRVAAVSYCHGHNGAEKHWDCSFEPTHWAYINLPE